MSFWKIRIGEKWTGDEGTSLGIMKRNETTLKNKYARRDKGSISWSINSPHNVVDALSRKAKLSLKARDVCVFRYDPHPSRRSLTIRVKREEGTFVNRSTFPYTMTNDDPHYITFNAIRASEVELIEPTSEDVQGPWDDNE